MAHDLNVLGKSVKSIIKNMLTHLEEQRYSKKTLETYKQVLRHLEEYMNENGIHEYNPIIGDDYIQKILDNRDYMKVSRWEKMIIFAITTFTEYFLLGFVKFRRCKTRYSLTGEIGASMEQFVRTRSAEYGFSESTTDDYRRQFRQLLLFFESQNINKITSISHPALMKYFEGISLATKNNRHRNLSIIKMYLRYIYETGAVLMDYSRIVPKVKRTKQPTLPSVYTKDEIQKMLASVERSSPKGKRDYAMLLLVVRYGLRASDVCELKFDELDWENSKIVMIQQKTKNRIELPILVEVGDAIIDYLKYGRPESIFQFVFLHVLAPYDRLASSTLHSIVTKYMRLAGITNKVPRKHGPHALRHSLAAILLDKKVPLPVISEVLGHENTESTRHYIRIDMNSLKQCAIDVPPLYYVTCEGGDDNECI